MKTSRIASALLAAVILLGGCKSPEEKLIDERTRLRASLDELYEKYGGREGTTDRSAPQQDAGIVGRLFAGMERSEFDEYCLAIGRGERPFALSGRLESFMRAPENARACRKAAETKIQVDRLEAELHPR